MTEEPSSAVKLVAAYFQNASAAPREVSLSFGPALEIIEKGALRDVWPYAEIRGNDSVSGVLRLRALSAPSDVRLEVYDKIAQARIREHCRLLAGESVSPAGETRGAWLRIVGILGAFVLAIWFYMPLLADFIAARLPASVEQKLGEAADSQVKQLYGGKSCAQADGAAALTKLATILQAAAELRLPATIVAVPSKTPNAFALPGGKVYLLSGLLAKAQNQDELAGVLAHEFGHLQHRDHIRRVISDGGAGLLISLLFGGVNGGGTMIFASKTLLFAAHSREAEAQADAFAAQTMTRLGRPTKPMGELLIRITGSEEDGISILHDHPLSKDRLDQLAAADRGATKPAPLTDSEWKALKAICA